MFWAFFIHVAMVPSSFMEGITTDIVVIYNSILRLL